MLVSQYPPYTLECVWPLPSAQFCQSIPLRHREGGLRVPGHFASGRMDGFCFSSIRIFPAALFQNYFPHISRLCSPIDADALCPLQRALAWNVRACGCCHATRAELIRPRTRALPEPMAWELHFRELLKTATVQDCCQSDSTLRVASSVAQPLAGTHLSAR